MKSANWLFEAQGKDPLYARVATDCELTNFRAWLIESFETYRSVLGDAPEQFRHNLAQHLDGNAWHLFLLNYFDSAGLTLCPPGKYGPDIVVKTQEGVTVLIEAVEASLGQADNPDRPVDLWKTGNDGHVSQGSDPKIQLRLAQALSVKYGKINRYLTDWGSQSTPPLIFAVNGAPLHRTLSLGTSYSMMFRTLYGLGENRFVINPETGAVVGSQTSDRFTVRRASGASVRTTFFRTEDHRLLAGVIFTRDDAFNLLWKRGGGIEFIPNVYAASPVPEKWCRFPYRFREVPAPDPGSFTFKVEEGPHPELLSPGSRSPLPRPVL